MVNRQGVANDFYWRSRLIAYRQIGPTSLICQIRDLICGQEQVRGSAAPLPSPLQ